MYILYMCAACSALALTFPFSCFLLEIVYVFCSLNSALALLLIIWNWLCWIPKFTCYSTDSRVSINKLLILISQTLLKLATLKFTWTSFLNASLPCLIAVATSFPTSCHSLCIICCTIVFLFVYIYVCIRHSQTAYWLTNSSIPVDYRCCFVQTPVATTIGDWLC